MNLQDAKSLVISEGVVKTIHNSSGNLLWGGLGYDTKYCGNIVQNGTPAPTSPVQVETASGGQTATISDGSISENYKIDLTGKNLFDQSTISTGDIRGLSPTIRLCSHQALWVPAGTYTVSTDAPSSYRYATTVNTVGAPPLANYPTYIIDTGWKTSSSFTFTINQGGWLAILFSKGNGTSTLTVEEVQAYHWQVEKNSSPTAYVPFYEPIELCKIGNYQDYIYKSGDDWYVHKEIEKAVLNGSEGWFLGQSLANTSHFNIADFTTIFAGAAVPPNDTAVDYCLSDHFEEKANLYSIDQVGIDFHSNKNLIVGVPNSISTTAANFKTWLASNNTLVYYRLANPTDTKITDSTLITRLNAVHEWMTRYGYQASISGSLPIIIRQDSL